MNAPAGAGSRPSYPVIIHHGDPRAENSHGQNASQALDPEPPRPTPSTTTPPPNNLSPGPPMPGQVRPAANGGRAPWPVVISYGNHLSKSARGALRASKSTESLSSTVIAPLRRQSLEPGHRISHGLNLAAKESAVGHRKKERPSSTPLETSTRPASQGRSGGPQNVPKGTHSSNTVERTAQNASPAPEHTARRVRPQILPIPAPRQESAAKNYSRSCACAIL